MNWLNDLLQNDPDPAETQEWIESIKAVIDVEGPERAHQLLENMVELTRRAGAHLQQFRAAIARLCLGFFLNPLFAALLPLLLVTHLSPR